MAIVITLSVRKVYLCIVVPDEFPVRLPHLIQRGSFVEVVIRETPHYPNYVELIFPFQNCSFRLEFIARRMGKILLTGIIGRSRL